MSDVHIRNIPTSREFRSITNYLYIYNIYIYIQNMPYFVSEQVQYGNDDESRGMKVYHV